MGNSITQSNFETVVKQPHTIFDNGIEKNLSALDNDRRTICEAGFKISFCSTEVVTTGA